MGNGFTAFFLLLLMYNWKDRVVAQRKPVCIIFGDSLADVGNNNYLNRTLVRADFLWYGVDYKNGMQPTGRFTNGRIVPDIIGEEMGFPIPPPYLSPTTDVDAILLKGVNYASGGGGILNETGAIFIERLSFNEQIGLFERTKASIANKPGHRDAAEKFIRDSMYLLILGNNDFLNNFMLPVYADSWRYSPDQFIDYLISTLRQQLTRLHSLGARKLILFGVGPLGCIPLQRWSHNMGGACDEDLNSWVRQFNSLTEKLLSNLNSQLPGSRFYFVDIYSVVADLIKNPQAYGFDVSVSPCCTLGRVPTITCPPLAKLCLDHSKFVFWDAYHPTDAANYVISKALIPRMQLILKNSTLPAPSPSPPHQG
eukprot:Gb_20605 [translate_table: standard]